MPCSRRRRRQGLTRSFTTSYTRCKSQQGFLACLTHHRLSTLFFLSIFLYLSFFETCNYRAAFSERSSYICTPTGNNTEAHLECAEARLRAFHYVHLRQVFVDLVFSFLKRLLVYFFLIELSFFLFYLSLFFFFVFLVFITTILSVLITASGLRGQQPLVVQKHGG